MSSTDPCLDPTSDSIDPRLLDPPEPLCDPWKEERRDPPMEFCLARKTGLVPGDGSDEYQMWYQRLVVSTRHVDDM
eukprot:3214134-Rhodomonas_salina.2